MCAPLCSPLLSARGLISCAPSAQPTPGHHVPTAATGAWVGAFAQSTLVLNVDEHGTSSKCIACPAPGEAVFQLDMRRTFCAAPAHPVAVPRDLERDVVGAGAMARLGRFFCRSHPTCGI